MSEEPTTRDILEAVQTFAVNVDQRFEKIEGQMATKDDIFRLNERMNVIEGEMATKKDLKTLEEKMVTEIDRFVVLHQTLDVELSALRSRCERMESFMVRVGEKLGMEYQVT